jgi:hypothetical protein
MAAAVAVKQMVLVKPAHQVVVLVKIQLTLAVLRLRVMLELQELVHLVERAQVAVAVLEL